MLRLFLILLFLLATTFLGGVVAVGVAPYYYYNKIITSGARFEWYAVNRLKPELITPAGITSIEAGNDLNGDWNKFNFKNQIVPLPVNNPFYYISPLFTYTKKDNSTQLGVSIANTKNEVITNVYFLESIQFPDISRTQQLFKFPIVKQILNLKSKEQIWQDIFKKDISNWNIEYKEMVYNLYLLELRNKIFAFDILGFSFDENNHKGIINVQGRDKDFNYEIVLTRRGNSINSIVITTSKDNPEALRIRNKILTEIEFVASTTALSNIIYQEFKALDYIKKIDHEGMLYLISAWSHKQNDNELLKYCIRFLERGTRNQYQLENIYEYMFARYGKTFATKKVPSISLKQEVRLKLETEIEEIRLAKKEAENILKMEKEASNEMKKKPTVKEDFELIIEKSRQNMQKNKKKVRLN